MHVEIEFKKLLGSIEVFDEPEFSDDSFVGITEVFPHPECGNCHYCIAYNNGTGDWAITAEAHGICSKGSKFWKDDVIAVEDEFEPWEVEMLKNHCMRLYDEMCHETKHFGEGVVCGGGKYKTTL